MENVELVTFMREHDGVTPEDASAQLGVSTRTLRKYVARPMSPCRALPLSS